MSGLVAKEEIELQETLFGEKKANGINGHVDGDLAKVDIGEEADGKKSS